MLQKQYNSVTVKGFSKRNRQGFNCRKRLTLMGLMAQMPAWQQAPWKAK